MRSSLIVALVAGVAAQNPPVSGGIRWSSSALRATRDVSGAVTSTKIASWSDTTATYAAVQADTNLQPAVKENAIFCHSSVQFGASALNTPTHVAMTSDEDRLEPSGDGFTMFALAKFDEGAGSGLVVSKGPPLGPNFWGLLTTVNNGDTLMWVAPSGSPTSAVVKQTFTDFNKWVVWSFVMNFTAGSPTLKSISPTRDGSTASWLNGGYSGAPSNTFTGTVNNTAGFRLGGNAFIYRGQLVDTLVFPRALSDEERTSVHTWYDTTYHLTCPTLNSTDAINGQDGKTSCAGSSARWWGECRQSCEVGFTMTHGATEHVCNAGEWTNGAITCEKTCPTLAAPLHIESCRRTLVDMTPFKLAGRSISMFDSKWFVYPRVPRTQRSTYWNVNGGASRIETRITGSTCAVGVPSFLVVDKPIWQSSLPFTSRVSVTLEMTPIAGAAGLVLRWLDEANHLRVMYDAPKATISISQVLGGVLTQLSNATFSPLSVLLRVEVQGAAIHVFDDSPVAAGASVLNATAPTLRQGSYGLASAGQANILSFKVTSDCDSGSACINSAPGTVCSYKCATGYRQVAGANDYSCGTDGLWGSNSLLCSIDPPIVNTTSKSVRENSLELALVGSPVDATSQARAATFKYTITQILGTSGSVGTPFSINDCSGQLIVAPGAVLNYEAGDLFSDANGRYYTVEVEVTPNGDAGNKGRGIVNVYIIDVNEAAAFAAPIISVSVMEDAIVGTVVSTTGPNFFATSAVDPDTFNAAFQSNVYVLESDAFPVGMFVLNAVTGTVTVNRTGALDFETQPELDLRIRVEDTVDNDLLNAYTLRVSVLNVNEAPLMASPQEMEVDETAATSGASLSLPVGARDPDNDPLGFSISTTTTDNNNKDPDNLGSGDVFSINGATGLLIWVQTKTYLPNSPTRVVDGRLVRQVYNLYVISSDGTLATTAFVKVYLMVNLTASALPTLTGFSVQTAALSLPSTLGGETLTITGTSFVKVPAYARVEVNLTEYNAAGKAVRVGVRAQTCVIVNSAAITCKTPTGVGQNLRLEVFLFDGADAVVPALYTSPLVFNYEAPFYGRVSNATGYSGSWPDPSLYMLRSSFGGRFYLHGTGFGRDVSRISAVYGPIVTTFPATIIKEWWRATVVATNGTMLTLDAQAGGFGQYMIVRLTVGGQVYTPTSYSLTFGYRAPVITNLTVQPGAQYSLDAMPTTAWSARIMIQGVDFPPNYWYAPDGSYNYLNFEGFYGNALRFPTGCTYDYPLGGCYKMLYCTSDFSTPSTLAYCYLPDSFGGNYTISLVIRDSDSVVYIPTLASHVTVKTPFKTFGHAKPRISLVSGVGSRNADTAGGQTLSISGTNLGPLSLNSATFGTVGLSARYGNRFTAPWDPLRPSARFQYEAKACKVVESLWTGSGRVECDTGEGVGLNHSLILRVGDQWSNEFANAVNYAAPIVASFDGPGATTALTAGFQEVGVYGKNFGNDLSVLQVSYQQVIDREKTAGLGSNQYVNIVTRNRNDNQFNFTPANCTFKVNHTALTCFTAPGAGGSLKWFVRVDGQLSRDPFSAYGPAQVTNISVGFPQDNPRARSKDSLNPAGFELLYIYGENFGPTTPRMLQWVRFSSLNVAPVYIFGSYVISVTHNLIIMFSVPGYGANYAFEFMVGDQESGRTAVTFSYVNPKLEYILPQNGTTRSIAPDQYRVRVFASNLPWNDLSVRYMVTVGNIGDQSRVTQNICTRDTTRAGIVQSVSCPWPSGSARKRQVVLIMDKPGVAGTTVQADSFATFDYREPNVYYTSADPASDPLWNVSIATITSRTATRVIQVVGVDFGARTGFDSIRRDVMLRNKTVGLRDDEGWVPIAQANARGLPNVIFSWTHDYVVFFTDTTNAEARLKITARDVDPVFGGNSTAEILSWSNIFDISITKPTIQSLEGVPTDGFGTSGGEVLTVNMPWPTLAGGAVKFQVELGNPIIHGYCKVLNRKADGTLPTWAPASTAGTIDYEYQDNTAGAFLTAACRNQFGNAPTDVSICKFYCTVPPSRGGSWVPVLLNVDDVRSNGVGVWFKPPVVSKITLVDSFNVLPAIDVYNVLTSPELVVSAPTSNATLIIEGTNFGTCPTLIISTLEFTFHKRSSCELSEDGVDHSVPPADRSHIKLTIPVPPGQGSKYNNLPFTLTIQAGGLADYGQGNMQPFGNNISFAWQRPQVLDFFPRSANTRGVAEAGAQPGMEGSLLTIKGRNFGAQLLDDDADLAVVRLSAPDGMAPILCANISRLDHFTITCNIPVGTGGNLDVSVSTLDLTGSSGGAGILFSYDRPAIADVHVERWAAELYDSWPAAWLANRTLTTPTTVVRTPAEGANGPTAGRYMLRIRGSNFGPADNGTNCVLVSFNYALEDCANPFFSATIQCRCQTALQLGTASADRSCDWSWADRSKLARPSVVYACNNREDAIGEGEVYSDGGSKVRVLEDAGVLNVTESLQGSEAHGAGLVLSWSHEEVTLLMPPGMGAHVVTVLARNQFPFMYNEMPFIYDAPEIATVKTLSGAIQTGPAANDIIELTGRNLGSSWPRYTPGALPIDGRFTIMPNGRPEEVAPNAKGLPEKDAMFLYAHHANLSGTPSVRSLESISEATAHSAATATLQQWRFCMSSTGESAALPFCDSNKNETRFSILYHSHSRIVFRSHPGIGVDRNLVLHVHSPATGTVMAKGNATFSYDAPMPTSVDPVVLAVPLSEWIDIMGYNFGDGADEQYYTLFEKMAWVVIDNVLWSAERSVNSTVAGSPSMGRISLPVKDLAVGKKDLAVLVAGQVGVLLANSTEKPLHVVCSAGNFGRLGEVCLLCPGGAFCDTPYISDLDYPRNMTDPVEANLPYLYPVPKPQFYNLNTTDKRTAGMDAVCPPAVRAKYPDRKDVCIVGCVPPEACAGENLCTEGYLSSPPFFRCGSCDKGFYRRSNECVKCPDSPWLLVIGFCMLAVAFCFVGFFLNKKNVNIAFLSIAVDYAQVVSMFASSRIAWPAEVKELLHILSAFNLNIEIIAPECIKPDISYVQKWGAIMLLPISASVVFLVVFAAGYVWKRCVKGQRGRAFLLSHQDALIAMFLILFYFMYLYITRTLLEVFNCVATDPDDGQTYMAAVFEPCGRPGGTQLFLMPMAIAGLLLYTAGYPLFCAWLLYKHRFEIMLDQLLRAKATGDSQMSNPHAFWMRIRFSRLYYQYKPDFFAWMLVVLMRKFLIAWTALMFRRDGGFQMAVALLVLFAAYALQVKWEPFMSPSDRGEVLRDHERARFEGGMHTRLAESLKEAAIKERKRTTKIDWAAPKAVLGKQILNKAGLFLFNYNTVESLLLGIAILICLAGIMFESLANRVDNTLAGGGLRVVEVAKRECSRTYQGYCTGLMWGVMMLISFSIIYLIVVVTVEVNGAFQEAKLAKANTVKRAKMAKKLGLDGSGGPTNRNSITRAVAKVTKDAGGEGEGDMDVGFASRIGVLETAVNPLFANAKGGDVQAKGAVMLDTDSLLSAGGIADMAEPPNPALWAVLRDTYKTLVDQTLKQREQIVALKRAQAEWETVKDAEHAREEELAAAYGLPSPKQQRDREALGREREAARAKMAGPGAALDGALEAGAAATPSGRPTGASGRNVSSGPGNRRKAFMPASANRD